MSLVRDKKEQGEGCQQVPHDSELDAAVFFHVQLSTTLLFSQLRNHKATTALEDNFPPSKLL